MIFRPPLVALLLLGLATACPAQTLPTDQLPPSPAPPAGAACGRITPEVLSQAEAGLAGLATQAEAALAAHGSGNYPGAMKNALDQFAASRERVAALRAWLADTKLLVPHVANTTAAYNVAGYTREAIVSLDLGRHWASVATAYDRSVIGRELLAASATAHGQLGELEADGLACYISAYVP